MPEDITESAKAIQEVAKTTGQAISTIEKIGSFFSKILGESISATSGMLADALKFKRWERQIILIDKAEKILSKRPLPNGTRVISPKLALPIFQYASIEENESLHDIWANLLATALDAACQTPRSSYIDVIRQLEPIDISILNFLHDQYNRISVKRNAEIDEKIACEKTYILKNKYGDNYDFENISPDDTKRIKKYLDAVRNNHEIKNLPTEFPLAREIIIKELDIDLDIYCVSIDNLIRQRLISPYTQTGYIPIKFDDEPEEEYLVSYSHGYEKVCVTTLGVSFVKACINIQ